VHRHSLFRQEATRVLQTFQIIYSLSFQCLIAQPKHSVMGFKTFLLALFWCCAWLKEQVQQEGGLGMYTLHLARPLLSICRAEAVQLYKCLQPRSLAIEPEKHSGHMKAHSVHLSHRCFHC
jgi:hypothetical protein